MTKYTTTFLIIVLSSLIQPVLAAVSTKWEPIKPVVVVIGNSPGSANETTFRTLAGIISKTNPSVAFIVETKPGADGVVALNNFVLAHPDGHTIAIPSHMSAFVTNSIWEKNVKRFEYSSFTNVITIGKSPLCIVANVTSKIEVPSDVVRTIQNKERTIDFAVGGGAHKLVYELLMQRLNGDRKLVQSISYQGPAQVVTSVASNTTELGVLPVSIARPLVEAGKIKIVAFTSDSKFETMPNVPLMRSAIPGFVVNGGWNIALPAGAAPEVVQWYAETFAAAMRTDEYRTWAAQNYIYFEEQEMSPVGLDKYLVRLQKSLAPLVQTIKVE